MGKSGYETEIAHDQLWLVGIWREASIGKGRGRAREGESDGDGTVDWIDWLIILRCC
jgi:hypothetical protein